MNTQIMLEAAFTVLRGLIYSATFVLLWVWVAVAVRPLDAGIPLQIPAWLGPLGVVLASAGALLAAVCIGALITRGRGTPAPFDPPREFVTFGPYRYVRNPMYLGGTAVILGAGLVVSSPSIAILAALFLLIAHLFVVLYEEPALAQKFGESYQRYRSSVHRWLPRRPPSQID